MKLTGLTAVAGYQTQIDADSQASPEQRQGGFADPRHGEVVAHAVPYAWESKAGQAGQHGPYGPENQLLGNETDFWMPGGEEWQDGDMDRTPTSHGGPWPHGISSGPVPSESPDAIANQLIQSRRMHAIDTHAGRRYIHTTLDPLQDEWVGLDELNPGHSDLVPLPKQAMSSGFMWGTRDRTQSMARQNEYGFDSAHMLRRYAVGPIPGNTYWLKPGGRPMVKSLPGPARPAVGVDSPFSGDDLGQAFSYDGAILQTVPTEYSPPPQVNLQAAKTVSQDFGDATVEWY